MGKGNFEYFIDRGYLDTQIAKLKAGLLAHIDHRFDELQEQLCNPTPVDADKKSTPDKKKAVEKDPCQVWKEEAYRQCKKLVKEYPDQHNNYNSVLTKIYTKIKNTYGICLDQEVKEYKNGETGYVPTIDAISVKGDLRSLFESILGNMEEECKLREEKKKAVTTAMLARTRQEIIQPLIDARNDHSIYGSATYSAVSARMRKKGIDIEAEKEAYRKKKGIKRRINRNELFDNDADMKKIFAETVAELLHEAGKADHERAS